MSAACPTLTVASARQPSVSSRCPTTEALRNTQAAADSLEDLTHWHGKPRQHILTVQELGLAQQGETAVLAVHPDLTPHRVNVLKPVS